MTLPTLTSVVVYLRTPAGVYSSVNMTSVTDYRAGTASCYGHIHASKSASGPVGHDQPIDLDVTIVSANPTGYQVGTEITVVLQPLGTQFNGWIDSDEVQPADRAGLWQHSLTITDVLTLAGARKCGITRPSEKASARYNAMATAHPELVPLLVSPDTVGGITQDPWVGPLTDPTMSVLDQMKLLAMARGQFVVSKGGVLLAARLPECYGGAPTWWAKYTEMGAQSVIGRDQLSSVPATTSRAAHITDVTVNYFLNDAEASQSIVSGEDFPTTLTIDSGLDVTSTTDANLTWLMSVATALTTAPTEPVLGATTIIKDFPEGYAPLQSLLNSAAERPLIEISPPPSHAGRYHVLDGFDIDISPTLELTVQLGLSPAALYGLRPLRFSDPGSTKPLTNTYYPTAPQLPFPGNPTSLIDGIATTFNSVAATRPQT